MEIINIGKKLIYQKDDIIIGEISYQFDTDNSVFINFFEVDEQYRGFGLGSAMLKDMITYFKSINVREISLEAIPVKSTMSISTLIDFYKNVGFSEIIRGTNYLSLSFSKESFKYKR